jgi:integrase
MSSSQFTPSSENLTPSPELERWQWPLIPTHYDRTPELTALEKEALHELGWDLRRQRGYDHLRPEWSRLERLTQPLDFAREQLYTPANRYHRRCSFDAVALILHGCETTGFSFWSWSTPQWLTVLGQDQQTLLQKFAGWLDGAVRPYMVAIAYLLECFSAFELLGAFNRISLATRLFGPTRVQGAVGRVTQVLGGWGYQSADNRDKLPGLISTLLLYNRSPYLEDVSTTTIENLRHHAVIRPMMRSTLFGVQRALAALGEVAPPTRYTESLSPAVKGVDANWEAWVERWVATSTLTKKVRHTFRTILLKVGRWLATEHPAIHEPAQWDRELCAAYLALVERMKVGDYTQRQVWGDERLGQPLSPRTKAGYIVVLRTFFHDCQEWEWIARRFDPARSLSTPPSILALIGPNPRVIADESWAKLLWAGLNLEAQDLPTTAGGQFYPLELMQALAIVWLFGGLRSDEIVRLKVGCVRWQSENLSGSANAKDNLAGEEVCLLDVPTNKTGTAFTKPVDPLLGRAIAGWEAVRPQQPAMLDRRTGERVQMLFCYRARLVAKEYLNAGLIPALCRKAGVPLEDVRGRITSHRARATIASQLYNAKEPMTLFELQA